MFKYICGMLALLAITQQSYSMEFKKPSPTGGYGEEEFEIEDLYTPEEIAGVENRLDIVYKKIQSALNNLTNLSTQQGYRYIKLEKLKKMGLQTGETFIEIMQYQSMIATLSKTIKVLSREYKKLNKELDSLEDSTILDQ